ncbi:MAG: PilZ domain-containing protein [Candidatus Omnitrophica bacterium]|nr:PilZ domain-containing protein [Candidatus Omnitrophota bacterium]
MSNIYSSGERRKHRRFRIHLKVLYRIDAPPFAKLSMGGKNTEALTLDLGGGGIAILTEHDISVLSLISIELMLSHDVHSMRSKSFDCIRIKGEVRSNVLQSDGRHRLGIAFSDISEEDAVKIAKFVKMGLSLGEGPYIY